MKIYKLTINGLITIPARLRKKYGLTPGRHLKFEVEKDGLKIIPLVTPEEVEESALTK